MSGKVFKKLRKQEKRSEEEKQRERELRDQRCTRVAAVAFKAIVDRGLDCGDIKDENGNLKDEVNNKYNEAAIDIVEAMLDNDLLFIDHSYVSQLLTQVISLLSDKVSNTLQMNLERAESEYWGKDILDISIKDVHLKLLANSKPVGDTQEK